MEKVLIGLMVVGSSLVTAETSKGAEAGRIGISAKVEMLSGNHLTERFAPGLSMSYETVQATESVGLRLDGNFSMRMGDILRGCLSVGAEWNMLPNNKDWHLALLTGLQGSVSFLTFDPSEGVSFLLASFVLDMGPQVGIQLLYQRPEDNLGWLVVLSGAAGWRKFLDAQVQSESSIFGAVGLALGVGF